jgi:hypothetical protein
VSGDRAAVRVCDDPVALKGLERTPAVHLRHHERIAVDEAVRGGLVDADGSRRRGQQGTSSRLADVPTEKRKRSTSPTPSASDVASSTRSSSAPKGILDPAERPDANARTWS